VTEDCVGDNEAQELPAGIPAFQYPNCKDCHCEVVLLLRCDFKLDSHFEIELLPGSKQAPAPVINSNRLRPLSKTTAACIENQ